MPDDADMLYIGPDVAPELLPIVTRAHDLSHPVNEPVLPFGAGQPAAEDLEAEDSRAWAAFHDRDLAIYDHLSRLTEMMPWALDRIGELDADVARDIAAAGDGGG